MASDSKRKRGKTRIITTDNSVKYTYNDINRLSAADLNALCRDLNIDTSFPKSAKVNAICHCLDVSTVGDTQHLTLTTLSTARNSLSNSQLRDLQALTPKFLYSLTDWSSDLSALPNIDDADVKRFRQSVLRGFTSDPERAAISVTTCLADLGSCTDCQQGGLLQLGYRWYSWPAARPAAVRLECRRPFGLLSKAVRTHNPIAS